MKNENENEIDTDAAADGAAPSAAASRETTVKTAECTELEMRRIRNEPN